MVDEGNVHDTAVILVERLKRSIIGVGIDLRVLRRLNDMKRLCTNINVERCGEAAMKDLEGLRIEVGKELGNSADDEQTLRAVLEEMFEIQKAKVPPWS